MLIKMKDWISFFIILSVSSVFAEDKDNRNFQKGLQFCENGDYISCILEYREALVKDPKNVAVHVNLGVVYFQNGFINDMMKELEDGEKELTDLPEYAEVIKLSAIISRERMKVKKECPPCVEGVEKVLKESVNHMEKAKELAPGLAEPYYNLGIIYHRQEKYEEALSNLLKVHGKYNLDKNYLYHLACTYSRLGKEKEAIYNLGKAIENGFRNKFLIDINSDFDNLRDEPQFIKLLAKISDKEL